MIKMSPDEVRVSAQKYSVGSEEVLTVLQTLATEQENLRANWEGTAFDTFDAQFLELTPKIQEFAQLLSDINTQLNAAADFMIDADAQLGQGIY